MIRWGWKPNGGGNVYFGVYEEGEYVRLSDVEKAMFDARSDEREKIKRYLLEKRWDGAVQELGHYPPAPNEPKQLPYLMVADLIDLPLSDPYVKAFKVIVDAINSLGDALNENRGTK